MSLSGIKISEIKPYNLSLDPAAQTIEFVVNVANETFRTNLNNLTKLQTLNIVDTLNVVGGTSIIANLTIPTVGVLNATTGSITNLTNSFINSNRGTFSTGLTGDLLGTVTGNLSGNARTAGWLNTTRTFRLTGDIQSDILVTDLRNGLTFGTQIQANTISNSNIRNDASIAGTKIVPTFEAQNITATGTITLSGNTANNPNVQLTNTSGTTNWSNLLIRKSRGTTGPVVLNDVLGGVIFEGLDNQNTYRSTGRILSIADGTPAGTSTSNSFVPGALTFQTSPSAGPAGILERMRIDSSGNVGIGTTSPTSKLQLAGETSQFPLALQINATGHATSKRAAIAIGDYLWLQDATGNGTKDFALYDSNVGAARISVTASGDVGIGTSSPTARLVVGNNLTGNAASTIFKTNAGSLGTTAGNTLKLASFGFTTSTNQTSLGIEALRTANGSTWETAAIGLKFDVDNTSPVGNSQIWMTVGGNIGIGTATPNQKLTVAHDSTDGGWLHGSSTNSYLGLGGYSIASSGAFRLNYDRSTGHITFSGGTRDVPVERMRITGSGNVGIGTAIPSHLLDVNGTARATAFIGPITGNVTGNISGTSSATTGPAFRAWAGTTTSVTHNVFTKVTLNTEQYDTNNNFASSRFTPTVAGYYSITGSIWVSGSGAIALLATLYKNGSIVTYGNFSTVATYISQVTDVIYCNGTTDYIELYAYHASGAVRTIAVSNLTTYMCGYLVRAA